MLVYLSKKVYKPDHVDVCFDNNRNLILDCNTKSTKIKMYILEPRSSKFHNNLLLLAIIIDYLIKGWIACGGESGLLKVLKLDAPSSGDAKATNCFQHTFRCYHILFI